MWKDDDDRNDCIYKDIIDKNINLPLTCHICEEQTLLFYMHKWDEKSKKGGLWIWCSTCRKFSHGTVIIPDWWRNSPIIPIELLNALPENLEKQKDVVISHLSCLLMHAK